MAFSGKTQRHNNNRGHDVRVTIDIGRDGTKFAMANIYEHKKMNSYDLVHLEFVQSI